MRILGKIFTYLEETLVVVGLLFMTVMNFVNVIARYLFKYSFSFTEEITVMAFVWITMLGIATGYKRYAHLGMSYFVDMFPRKLKAIMALVYMVCSVYIMYLIIRYGWEVVQGQIALDAKTPALGLPTMYQGLAMPIGGAFIIIRVVQAYLKLCRDNWTGRPREDSMITEAKSLAGMDDELLADTGAAGAEKGV